MQVNGEEIICENTKSVAVATVVKEILKSLASNTFVNNIIDSAEAITLALRKVKSNYFYVFEDVYLGIYTGE